MKMLLHVFFLWFLQSYIISGKIIVNTSVGLLRSVPLFGFGNEIVFQSVDDLALSEAVHNAGSLLSRFPGGTPSGFWDWKKGWTTNDFGPDVIRQCTPEQFSAYLREKPNRRSVFVLNVLTSNLTYELEGLLVHTNKGSNISFIELGNEMFDQSVPEIAKIYPTPESYASAMLPWIEALQAKFPNSSLAICGSLDPTWLHKVITSPAALKVHAVTLHIYTPITDGPYTSKRDLARIVDQARLAFYDVKGYVGLQINPSFELWFTEYGFYGAKYAQRTWLLGLSVAIKTILLAQLKQTKILLPYCLVCHDAFMPSFTTPLGPMPPPPNASYAPGPWWLTPQGVLGARLFQTLVGMTSLFPLIFTPSITDLPNNEVWCELHGVGSHGEALPESGQKVLSSNECQHLCQTNKDCAFWQWMYETQKCWLKNKHAYYSHNAGSSAGPAHCSSDEVDSPLAGWMVNNNTHGSIVIINPSSLNVSLSLSQPTSLTGKYVSVYPKSIADVSRQNLRPEELVTLQGTINWDDLILVHAYSILTIHWSENKLGTRQT